MSRPVDLSPAGPVAVLEIGGTHVTAAVVDPSDWTVRHRVRRELAAQGGREELLGTLIEAADTLPVPDGSAWGVAMPDPFDYEDGIAWFAGVGKFESLYGVDVGAVLRSGIARRPAGVRFLNDADAFGLGEWVDGAVAGLHRCAALTLGTGVGSAFVLEGRVLSAGPGVPPGGRAHRIEVGGRPLEDLVSRRAIRSAYVAAADVELDVREISELARGGDPVARDVLESAFRTLGSAVGPSFVAFGADAVVVGGSMAASWDLFGPWFAEGCADAGVVAPPMLMAVDADGSPLVGTAYNALAR